MLTQAIAALLAITAGSLAVASKAVAGAAVTLASLAHTAGPSVRGANRHRMLH